MVTVSFGDGSPSSPNIIQPGLGNTSILNTLLMQPRYAPSDQSEIGWSVQNRGIAKARPSILKYSEDILMDQLETRKEIALVRTIQYRRWRMKYSNGLCMGTRISATRLPLSTNTELTVNRPKRQACYVYACIAYISSSPSLSLIYSATVLRENQTL